MATYDLSGAGNLDDFVSPNPEPSILPGIKKGRMRIGLPAPKVGDRIFFMANGKVIGERIVTSVDQPEPDAMTVDGRPVVEADGPRTREHRRFIRYMRRERRRRMARRWLRRLLRLEPEDG